MSMKDYDVILGMDFLSISHVVVDCYAKGVVFKIPREVEFTFCQNNSASPPCLISSLQAQKLLLGGRSEFLTMVTIPNQKGWCWRISLL